MPLKKREPLEHKPSFNDLYDILVEGEGSLVNADKVDGLHANELASGQLPQVEEFPTPIKGKIVLLVTDGHVYVATEVV